MAPAKFGLFRARSRDQQEQPMTENLLQTSVSADNVTTPDSPAASKEMPGELNEDISALQLDSDDEGSKAEKLTRRISMDSVEEENQPQTTNYVRLRNQISTDATSSSTLNNDDDSLHDNDSSKTLEIDDGASTSCDANSLRFDETSLAPSEDISMYCAMVKKSKNRKEEQHRSRRRRDFDMWQASNIEVMQNLLSGRGTYDEQIKWEAIATARGLCTLKDNCTCRDCGRAKSLAMADGDGGMGAVAPVAIGMGCSVQ